MEQSPADRAQVDLTFRITSSLLYSRKSLGGARESQSNPSYLFPYHQARLMSAASAFQWPAVAETLGGEFDSSYLSTSITDHVKSLPPEQQSDSLRIRVLVSKDAEINVESTPIAQPPAEETLFPPNLTAVVPPVSESTSLWRVYIDMESTSPSLLTTHKTTARDHYTAARSRLSIVGYTSPEEVLLWNPNGDIMEGSITTVYFQRSRGDQLIWVTPSLESGCNAGVTRRYALQDGFCQEQTVSRNSVKVGERVVLSNGVKGFVPGVICEP